MKDVLKFRHLVEKSRGGAFRKCCLLGQSMCGLIATAVVLEDQRRWDQLMLLSPFFGLDRAEKVVSICCELFDLIVPRIIWNNPIPAVYLTHDEKRKKEYERDVLIQRRITIRLAKEMFRASASIFGRAEEILIPCTVFAAGNDKVVSLKKTKNFVDRMRSRNKKLKVFEDFYHELLHETERIRPIRAIKENLIDMGL